MPPRRGCRFLLAWDSTKISLLTELSDGARLCPQSPRKKSVEFWDNTINARLETCEHHTSTRTKAFFVLLLVTFRNSG